MTGEQVVMAANAYAARLAGAGVAPEQCREETRGPDGHEAMRHAMWMCGRIPEHVRSGKIEKAMRWLGFVQCVMWASGLASLTSLKDDNR